MMNTILVPTDFSDNADNALKFAVNIANHFRCNIYLLNVYEVHSITGSFVSIRNYVRKDAEEGLSRIVKQVKNSLYNGTTLEAHALEGVALDLISQVAKSIKADLIVMGTQGASGLKEIFFGSNTAGVIRKTQLPVLAIPSGYEYRGFKQILLAVGDKNLNSPMVLEPLKVLAKSYHSNIEITHVKNPESESIVNKEIPIFLSDLEPTIQLVESENINEGVNLAVEKIGADLLCMIKRERGFLKNLFHKSITKKEVFNSPIPLLILSDSST